MWCETLPGWVSYSCLMWGHILQNFGWPFFEVFFSLCYTCVRGGNTKRASCLNPATGFHEPCRNTASMQSHSLLLLNLAEVGHIQVWALTVTQMGAEMLWSHKLHFLQNIFQLSGIGRSQGVKLPAPASPFRACFMPVPFFPTLTFKFPAVCCALCRSWKNRRKMPIASHWHSAFLGSTGSSCFIQQAHMGWALSHDPGACSCCCFSVLVKSV